MTLLSSACEYDHHQACYKGSQPGLDPALYWCECPCHPHPFERRMWWRKLIAWLRS